MKNYRIYSVELESTSPKYKIIDYIVANNIESVKNLLRNLNGNFNLNTLRVVDENRENIPNLELFKKNERLCHDGTYYLGCEKIPRQESHH